MSTLLERDVELQRLRTLLDDARRGRGRVAFVSGEAGIGKTTLVTEFVRTAASDDARVAFGRCDALATPRALGAFVDAAAMLGVDNLADRDGLLGSLLDELRGGTPTIVVIEDAHWADDASIELLGMLGRRVADVAALVIVTYRDEDVPSDNPLRMVIGDLVTSNATAWIGLRPLSLAAVGALIADRGVAAEALLARTGGNPFYVTEALASPDDEVPATVRLAVLARARRLDLAARAVLDAVAIVPGHAERWLVDAIADQPPESMTACLAAGMLVAGPDTVAFRHELARIAVWAEIPDATLRSLHARALAALAGRGGVDPARVAHHAIAAGDEAAVAHWSMLASRDAARRTAHPEAISHGEQALRAAGRLGPDEVAEVRLSVARSLSAVSRPEDAELMARDAAAHWRGAGDDRREADALVVVSQAMATLGRTQESMVPVGRAIELLERRPPGAELANAYIRMTSAHMLARERDSAVEWGRKAIALSSELGDPTLLARSLTETGIADVMDGRYDGLRLVRQAIDIGIAHDLPGVVSAGFVQIGSGCGELRRYDIAVPALEEGIGVATSHRIESNRRYQLAWLARCRFDLGQWDEAAGHARDALAGRATLISRFVALNTLGWLRARRGEDDVWPALDESLEIASLIAHLQRLWPCAVARAEAGWLQDDLSPHVPMLHDVLELATRCRHAIAIGEIGVWLRRAGAIDSPPAGAAEPFASWIAGDHLGAASGFRAMGCPYETASALAESGDTTSMREAWATFDRLGAVPMTERVAGQLAERGVRVMSSSPRGALRPAGSGLSDREVEVLQLVSAGFSNPQIAATLFISRKTAEHHVSNILAKLGLSNRAEAAAAAVRLGVARD